MSTMANARPIKKPGEKLTTSGILKEIADTLWWMSTATTTSAVHVFTVALIPLALALFGLGLSGFYLLVVSWGAALLVAHFIQTRITRIERDILTGRGDRRVAGVVGGFDLVLNTLGSWSYLPLLLAALGWSSWGWWAYLGAGVALTALPEVFYTLADLERQRGN